MQRGRSCFLLCMHLGLQRIARTTSMHLHFIGLGLDREFNPWIDLWSVRQHSLQEVWSIIDSWRGLPVLPSSRRYLLWSRHSLLSMTIPFLFVHIYPCLFFFFFGHKGSVNWFWYSWACSVRFHLIVLIHFFFPVIESWADIIAIINFIFWIKDPYYCLEFV